MMLIVNVAQAPHRVGFHLEDGGWSLGLVLQFIKSSGCLQIALSVAQFGCQSAECELLIYDTNPYQILTIRGIKAPTLETQ